MTPPNDVADLIDSAFRLNVPDRDWLVRVAAALSPLLPESSFQCFYLFEDVGRGELQTRQSVRYAAPQESIAFHPDHALAMSLGYAHALRTTGCHRIKGSDGGRRLAQRRSTAVQSNDGDWLLLTAWEDGVGGFACVVGLNEQGALRTVQQLWSVASAHIAQALRIRALLQRPLVA